MAATLDEARRLLKQPVIDVLESAWSSRMEHDVPPPRLDVPAIRRRVFRGVQGYPLKQDLGTHDTKELSRYVRRTCQFLARQGFVQAYRGVSATGHRETWLYKPSVDWFDNHTRRKQTSAKEQADKLLKMLDEIEFDN